MRVIRAVLAATFVLAALVAIPLAIPGAIPGAIPAAHATNVVANPGFEADDASGGPVTPPTSWSVLPVGGIADAGVEDGFANSGNNAGYIGYGALSQSLATVIGTTYTVSFFVGIDDTATLTDPNASFDATVSGSSLGTVDLLGSPMTPGPPTPGSFIQCPNPATPCSAEITDTFTAQDTSTLLTFTGLTSLSGQSPIGLWYLDDVSVDDGSTAIPEPSVMLVLAAALGLLTVARARRA
jgi:hypothetical protein